MFDNRHSRTHKLKGCESFGLRPAVQYPHDHAPADLPTPDAPVAVVDCGYWGWSHDWEVDS